jgi:hypothetical protein
VSNSALHFVLRSVKCNLKEDPSLRSAQALSTLLPISLVEPLKLPVNEKLLNHECLVQAHMICLVVDYPVAVPF